MRWLYFCYCRTDKILKLFYMYILFPLLLSTSLIRNVEVQISVFVTDRQVSVSATQDKGPATGPRDRDPLETVHTTILI